MKKNIIHELIMCTNVFVRKDGKYLLLKRAENKKWAPGKVHAIGGKIDPNENPLEGAKRELWEESGIRANNYKLEVVFLEIAPYADDPNNWLVFYFTADYESGEPKGSEEGDLLWLSPDEIYGSDLISSMKPVIKNILNPKDGTIFGTLTYDGKNNVIIGKSRIKICPA
ncbi:MAG: NUDIX domain-containing protein [Parcubacteria group bacterium]|jgi:8-oxo-dGTP diphosphatase